MVDRELGAGDTLCSETITAAMTEMISDGVAHC